MITFSCPECGEAPDGDGSRYVVDGIDVCSFQCWTIRLGAHKAVITAAFFERDEPIPSGLEIGNC